MAGISFFKRGTGIAGLLLVALALVAPLESFAQADKVTTYRDQDGWKLQVNGEDFFIKGVVWGYSPRGQNYSYNLWGETDEYIRKVLDYEFGLMKKAGINAIRSFTMIPPEWVTYIYREHGIMSVINPLMGRYGYLVGGKWVPFTDYSDPLTRETLIADMTEFVRQYKDVPGVLMFAFGNESNYGLSWSSFEIENLPVGEQNKAKAVFLYTLWNEVIEAGKALDSNHPFTIVNGDIQYIDLIAEHVTAMDLLGSNAYRGPSFTSLWRDVKEKLDLPVVFFEFGSDAFNARTFQEDQLAQALILKDQWQEMYNKSYGNGEEGNSLGAFVFEWRDEWWKYLQVENLNIQDNNASWSNQAYLFDWAEGKNNMNEEWFGITGLGLPNEDGVFQARPRMAYDMLAEVFEVDPYTTSKRDINLAFANLDLDLYELKGDVRLLKAQNAENRQKLQLTGGDIQGQFSLLGTEKGIREEGENAVFNTNGQMVNVDFAFEPSQRINGQFSINVLGEVADTQPLRFEYGQRGLPLVVEIPTFENGEFEERTIIFDDRERIEIYDFNAKYEGENIDVEAFYHTPRFHWGYEGDFFGLIAEATDIPGIDVFNGKAPVGIEMTGKGALDGLTFVAGPEIYWGANPKWVVKYDFNTKRIDWTFIHSEDVGRLGQGANATQATIRQSRQTTLSAQTQVGPVKIEAGGMMASTERIDEVYDRIDDQGNIIVDQIDFADTLAFRGKLTFPVFGAETYVSTWQAGLVSESSATPQPTFGLFDPTRLPYSGLGNKREYELGSIINVGNLMIFPRLMYRDNLVDANPFVEPAINPDGTLNPGLIPRDRDNDPFAVLGNRAARSAEVFFTWDPTGATPFYDWDNEWREDAKFAFNIGFNYTEFPTATDANLFFFEEGAANASFGIGLPAENVWSISSRMVFNPGRSTRYIATFLRSFDQPTGDPTGGSRDFWQIGGAAYIGQKHIVSGFFNKNGWGPEDFFRQFNITYDEQVEFDYSFLLGGSAGLIGDQITLLRSTRIGFRTVFRTPNESSLDVEFQDGENDFSFLSTLYFTYRF